MKTLSDDIIAYEKDQLDEETQCELGKNAFSLLKS